MNNSVMYKSQTICVKRTTYTYVESCTYFPLQFLSKIVEINSVESINNYLPGSWSSACTPVMTQPSREHCLTAFLYIVWPVCFNDSKKIFFNAQVQANGIPLECSRLDCTMNYLLLGWLQQWIMGKSLGWTSCSITDGNMCTKVVTR